MTKAWICLLLAGAVAACADRDDAGTGNEPAVAEQSVAAATAAVAAVDAPVASPIAEEEPRKPVVAQEIAYGESNDDLLDGYLAMPADIIPPRPGIIVIHDWWGLNEDVKAVTRRLAGEGFIALAVDLYGGEIAATPQQARTLMQNLADAPLDVLANLHQAYEFLEAADSSSVATLGWSLGGAWSLQAALEMPDELDAMVMYYGQVLTDEQSIAQLQVPMLGLFGENDTTIPVADVKRFRATLTRLAKDSEILIYSGAGHGFADRSGESYDSESAQDAWQQTIDFLNRSLR